MEDAAIPKRMEIGLEMQWFYGFLMPWSLR